MNHAPVGLFLLQATNPVWILAATLVGGFITAATNLVGLWWRSREERKAQRDQWKREDEAQRDQWRREDELRLIDERRPVYTDFFEKSLRLMELAPEAMDGPLKQLVDLPELPTWDIELQTARDLIADRVDKERTEEQIREGYERKRRVIAYTVNEAEQLQKAIDKTCSETKELLTPIALLGSDEALMAANSAQSDTNERLRNEVNEVTQAGLKIRRAELEQAESTEAISETSASFEQAREKLVRTEVTVAKREYPELHSRKKALVDNIIESTEKTSGSLGRFHAALRHDLKIRLQDE